jgi:hypothetical protein
MVHSVINAPSLIANYWTMPLDLELVPSFEYGLTWNIRRRKNIGKKWGGRKMDDDYPGPIGAICGTLTALVTFLYSWYYAVENWGWLLGLAFGWIPAAIVALMAGAIVFFLWGLIVLGLGLLWLFNR